MDLTIIIEIDMDDDAFLILENNCVRIHLLYGRIHLLLMECDTEETLAESFS